MTVKAPDKKRERRGDPGYEPDLSLVMPCYNEEEMVAFTIARLMATFQSAGYHLQLVAIDNGSSDRTGEIIASLASKHRGVRCHRIKRNEGYGNGS
jgi:glycosyltransferase involved in cell wall biosynthesis